MTRGKKYYMAHRDELVRKAREKRQADMEGNRAYNRAYYARNREKLCRYQREYAAKRKAAALAELEAVLGRRLT